jgi:hypothetical protein
MTNAISSYTESMYEAGGGKGGSTGMSNKKGASGATGQATTSTSETQKAPGAPGAPGQKWWEVYKAQKKPTASLSGGAPAGPPGESSRGRDGSKEQASSRGRDGGHEWKVSDPVIKKDVDDAKTKEALQQKLYKDAAKEREEQKKEQAKEVDAERKELLEEALKRIAAKEVEKEEEEKLAKHLKELAASCLPALSRYPYLCLLVLVDEPEWERDHGHFASGFPDSSCTLTPICTLLCMHIYTHTGGATTAGA